MGTMTEMATTGDRTVGQVAESVGVTVRTLHHYDEIGLVTPSCRSSSGYRLYTGADLTRLQHVVVYRRLGFALEDIRALLDDPDADVAGHLRRQRSAVMTRRDEMTRLVDALDRALEAHMSGTSLSRDEQRELFGDAFTEEYAAEAQERWGDTEAWAQSRRRTAAYTREDWVAIKADEEAVTAAFVAAMRAGEPASGERATEAAEAHRRHIDTWFYDLPHAMHRGLGDLYTSDERFTRTYEDRAPGLAVYVRDAIRANADRHEG